MSVSLRTAWRTEDPIGTLCCILYMLECVYRICSMTLLVSIERGIHFLEREIHIVEVSQPVILDRITLVWVSDTDPNCFGEVEVCRLLDIDDRLERNCNADTLSLVLSAEDGFLDRLDPLVTARFTVSGEMPFLFGG